MRGFVVVKNIKSPLEDITFSGESLEKNVDYSLLVDVALLEKRVKQVESDDEDEDVTFILQPTGRIHLVKNDITNPYEDSNPHSIVGGHIVTDTD